MCVFLSVLGPRGAEAKANSQCMAVEGGNRGGGACWFQSVTAANWITVCFSAVADSRLMWFLQLPKTNWSGLIHSPHKEKDREVQRGGRVVWMRSAVSVWDLWLREMSRWLDFVSWFWPQCRNRELREVCVLAASAEICRGTAVLSLCVCLKLTFLEFCALYCWDEN